MSEKPSAKKSLIQLWQVDKGSSPKMVFGIAQDFGKVWSLKWLPSGGRMEADSDQGLLPRQGLLAAACSDGTVRVFTVPELTPEEGLIYKPSKVLTLWCEDRTAGGASAACTDLAWYRGPGHKVRTV